MAGRKTTRQLGSHTFNQAVTGRQPSSFFKRGVAAFISASVTALLAITALPGNVATAHAWTDGNRYALPYKFDHINVTYFIDPTTVPSWDVGHVNDAAQAWNDSLYNGHTSKLYYVPGGTSTTTADVQITGTTVDKGWSGQENCPTYSNGICPTRQGASYIQLYFDPNNPTLPQGGGHASYSDTPTSDQGIAGHEEGHSVGLDHSCVAGALMQGPNPNFGCTGYGSAYLPQPDDADGLIQLYGQWQPPPPPACPPFASLICYAYRPAPPNTKEQVLTWLESLPPDQIPLNP
jgi:hypothetical protein